MYTFFSWNVLGRNDSSADDLVDWYAEIIEYKVYAEYRKVPYPLCEEGSSRAGHERNGGKGEATFGTFGQVMLLHAGAQDIDAIQRRVRDQKRERCLQLVC